MFNAQSKHARLINQFNGLNYKNCPSTLSIFQKYSYTFNISNIIRELA